MTQDDHKDEDLLPDKDAAKEFYAKYEPKEVLGRWEKNTILKHCWAKIYQLELCYYLTIIENNWCFDVWIMTI